MGRPPMDVRDVDPPNEAVRRILLCVYGMGGASAVQEWLDVPPNTFSRYLYGREPTLRRAVDMAERSTGLLLERHWCEGPHKAWPPADLQRAYDNLMRGRRSPAT